MVVDTELRAGLVERVAEPEEVDDHDPVPSAQAVVESTEVVAGGTEPVHQQHDPLVVATRGAAVEDGERSGASPWERGWSPTTYER